MRPLFLLNDQIKYSITRDTSQWSDNYMCKPSLFIKSKKSDFYIDNKEICNYECNFILSNQEAYGTWKITWEWTDYLEERNISKNWWKSDLIIKNLLYIKKINQ